MDGQEYAEYRERDYERETDERGACEHQHGLGRKGHVFCDGVELLGCCFQCCESEFGCVHCQGFGVGAHDSLRYVCLLLTLSTAYNVPDATIHLTYLQSPMYSSRCVLPVGSAHLRASSCIRVRSM